MKKKALKVHLAKIEKQLARTQREVRAARAVQSQAQPVQVEQSLNPAMFGEDPSMYGFRKITGPGVPRDLPLPTQQKMQDMAYYLYLTNPLAQWLINVMKDYIVGEGVTLKCQDARTQAIVDAWWKDPVNNFPKKLGNKVRELSLYGEQCYPVFVAQGTGHVRLGYLDPVVIDQVMLDPDNAEQPIGIVTKQILGDAGVPGRKYRVILSIPEEELTPLARQLREGFTDGDCFYFAVNKVSNGSRGISDLIARADWLDGYEQFLYQRLERSDLANRIVFDLEMQGLTQEEINKRMKDFRLPRPGGVHGHNEKVKLTATALDLKAMDATADSKMFLHQCMAGLPEHWFAGGEGSNRATASEMDEPTFKMFSSRQRDIKAMLEEMGAHAIDEAKKAGYLEQDADESVLAVFPEMVTADLSKIGPVIQCLSQAIAQQILSGTITKAEGRLIFSVVVNSLGVELPAMDAAAMAEAEAQAQFDDASADYRKGSGKVDLESGSQFQSTGNQARVRKLKLRAL